MSKSVAVEKARGERPPGSTGTIDRRQFLERFAAAGAATSLLLESPSMAGARQHAGVGTGEGLASWVSSRAPGRPMAEEVLGRLERQPGMLRLLWRPKGAVEWKGEITAWRKDDKDKSTLRGLAGRDGLFSATLSARDFAGALRLTVKVSALRQVSEAFQVLLGADFHPGAWERQFYPKLPYQILSPAETATAVFLANAEDATEVSDWPHCVYYPFGVIENQSGFLFWGAMDIGKFRVLSPNAVPQNVPCFSDAPLSMREGEVLDFDLCLKWFPKPEFRYRDVLRWYLRSMENSDPLSKDWLLPWDGEFRARSLPKGILYGGLTPEMLGPLKDSPRVKDAWLERMADLRIGSLWFEWWDPEDCSYATEGSWKLSWGWPLETSATELRDELAWMRRNHLNPMMYFNQLFPEKKLHQDRPPYASWLGRDPHGLPQSWPGGEYSCADFGNEDFRSWYLSRVKACLDFYNPSGVAWDMCWGLPQKWEYSRANPRTSNAQGIARVQAEIWRWLREHYPEKRVITNEAPGTISQLFSDAILLESPYDSGKTELDYEAGKALGTTIIAYEYPETILLRGLPAADHRYLAFRYRATDLDTGSGEYVLTCNPGGIPENTQGAIAHSDLQADGQWHTLVVDLNAKQPGLKEVKCLGVQVLSGAGGHARLEVSYIRLTPNSNGEEGPPPALADSLPATVDARHVGLWLTRPKWIHPAIHYGLRANGGTTEFFAEGAGLGMKWVTVNRPAIVTEYLKALSYGGCIGGGGPIEELAEINTFSAEAMSTPLLVDSHDVEVEDAKSLEGGHAVTASAWAGQGRLLLAAFNGGQAASSPKITLAAPPLKAAGIHRLSPWVVRVLGADGRPFLDRKADASFSSKDGLQVSIHLNGSEGLLFKMGSDRV